MNDKNEKQAGMTMAMAAVTPQAAAVIQNDCTDGDDVTITHSAMDKNDEEIEGVEVEKDMEGEEAATDTNVELDGGGDGIGKEDGDITNVNVEVPGVSPPSSSEAEVKPKEEAEAIIESLPQAKTGTEHEADAKTEAETEVTTCTEITLPQSSMETKDYSPSPTERESSNVDDADAEGNLNQNRKQAEEGDGENEKVGDEGTMEGKAQVEEDDDDNDNLEKNILSNCDDKKDDEPDENDSPTIESDAKSSKMEVEESGMGMETMTATTTATGELEQNAQDMGPQNASLENENAKEDGAQTVESDAKLKISPADEKNETIGQEKSPEHIIHEDATTNDAKITTEGNGDGAGDKEDGNSKEDDGDDDKQPTDEYGRPLSAYEIMRLERIKRNKAYLAQLGLEGDKKSGKKRTLLSAHQENMQKRKALKKKEKKEVMITRRSTMSRRTKGKNINYSEPTVAEFKLPPSERKKDTDKDKEDKEDDKKMSAAALLDKKERKEKRENRVPLFIYQELKQVERERKQALRTAEKLVRASEKEMKIIERQVDKSERKEKLRREKEEKKALGPIINELDRRRTQLIKALRKVDNESRDKRMTADEWKKICEEKVSYAREKFPENIKEAERTLGQALMDRLPPFKQIEQQSSRNTKGNNGNDAPKKSNTKIYVPSTSKKKAKASKGGVAENDNNTGESSDTTRITHSSLVTLPCNLDLEKLQEVANRSKRRDSNKITKTRNVGGPVTENFGATVQRKWLESDVPVAPTLNEYSPQAGDTVLYYPCAHYNFLRKHPDIRCKKNRLALRKPLWQRAVDEMKALEEKQDAKKNTEEPTTKRKSNGEKSNPWWTMDWISTVQCGAGRYPILCRVEKVIAEFPFDEESASEIRKYNYQQKKGSGGETKEKKKQVKNRQKPSRHKPPIGISVTLKALAPVSPPTQSRSNENGDGPLSPPPLFSVLTFPSDKASQFLVPFASAYRSSFSFVENEAVKIIGKEGARHNATIVASEENPSDTLDSVCREFASIIKKHADLDFTTTHKLDAIIAEGFSSIKENLILPEGDFRAAIQTILYHYHTREKKVGQSISPNIETGSHIVDQSEVLVILNLTNLILSTLPKWNSIKVREEGSELVKSMRPWKLSSTNDNNESNEERTITAALAPSIFISSQRVCSAGLIYSLDETLRGQIEMFLKYIIENDPKATVFVSPVTDSIAPDYSRFVPIGMCLRRILKRLKPQSMRFPRHYNRTAEDSLEDQNYDEYKCCYYRNLSSLHSDIADIFQNCLLYNAPESGIVQDAYDVTTFLSVAIDKLADDRLREQLEIRRKATLQMKNVESVARGELGLFKASKKTSVPANEIEDYNISFNRPLNRDWIKVTSADEINQYSGAWLPQCGDKVIYNRILHGKFINTHINALPPRHRALPSILPSSRKKREKIAKSTKNENSRDDGKSESDIYQYWLGTIVWTRPVFPNLEEESNGDETYPFLAIGIQFHYRWLAKSVHVLYWKPCTRNSENENVQSTVEEDGVSGSPFLSPAWMGPKEKVLPPFPLSAARVAKPTGLLPTNSDLISKCLLALKKRVVENRPVDAFEPDGKDGCSFFVHDIPSRFHHVFDENNANDIREEIDFSSLTSEKELSKVVFIPSWSQQPSHHGKESTLSTRGRNSMVPQSSSGSGELPFHETIMANPFLCLDLIHQRVEGGYYRNLMAVIEDIREAFVTNAIYVVKERIRSRRLGKASEGTVLRAIINSCGIEIKSDSSGSSQELDPTPETGSPVQKNTACDIPVTISDLNHQERSALVHLQAIHKVYSTALSICTNLPIAETIFGLEPEDYIQQEYPEDTEKEEARRITNQILSALGPDKTKFRKGLPVGGSKPSVTVTLKLDTKQNDCHPSSPNGMDSSHANIGNPIALEASDFHENFSLRDTLFVNKSKISSPIKVIVRCNGLSDLEWENISNQAPLKIQPEENISAPSITVSSEGRKMSPDKSSNVPEEPNGEEDVDFTQAVIFNPSDYENDAPLIRALFCRSKRKNPCARCVLKKNDLFTCRVQLAHSNLDFIWCDYFKKIGGVRGILTTLDPANITPAGEPSPVPINDADSNANDFHSDSNVAGTTGDNGNTGDKIALESNDVQAPPLPEIQAKASRALNLSRSLLAIANKAIETPVFLSDEFMNDNFSIDPDDGHFEICHLCGLGGDVICCESCPAVSHPKCIGANNIPDEDWHCFKCKEKERKKSSTQQDFFDILNEDDDFEPGRSMEDKVEYSTNTVTSLLEELKSYRQKPAPVELGSKIMKEFHGTSFIGKVVSLPSKEASYYAVLYDDGDNEDLTLEEIQPLIDAYNNMPEQKIEPIVEVKRRGRQRRSPEEDVDEADVPFKRKRGVSSKRSYEEESPEPVRRRGRGRPRKKEIEESLPPEPVPKRGRGRPRKHAPKSPAPSPEQPKRGRGRPRKRIRTSPSPSPDPPKTGRGRGRKRALQDVPLDQTPSKRGRGRQKKQTQELSGNTTSPEDLELLDLHPDQIPEPGHVDKKVTYYCTKENDTSVSIARVIGCDSWRDIAYIPENLARFPALRNKKTKFRSGTFVRIGEANFVLKKAMQLVEDTTE